MKYVEDLPAALLKLRFSDKFNSYVGGYEFDQALDVAPSPPGLRKLFFGFCFNQPLSAGVQPVGLRILMMSNAMPSGVLAEGLLTPTMGDSFNRPPPADLRELNRHFK
jgi:hypothetical protein